MILASTPLASDVLASGGQGLAPSPPTIAILTLYTVPHEPAFGFVAGTAVQLVASFADATTANPVDPTTVAFTVHAPYGGIVSPAPVRQGTGVYFVDQLFDGAGEWHWKVVGSGAVEAADAMTITVRAV